MTPEQMAEKIISSWGVPQPDQQPSGTALERLVRMLDEERTMRFAAERKGMEIVQMIEKLNAELDWSNARRNESSERIQTLHQENNELSRRLANSDTFKARNDARLAENLINHLHMEHRDFFDPTMDKIPMIKKVREEFGIGLKEAKELVDVWEFDHRMAGVDAENAAEVIAHEDEGTFEEEVDLSGPEVDNPFLVDADR